MKALTLAASAAVLFVFTTNEVAAQVRTQTLDELYPRATRDVLPPMADAASVDTLYPVPRAPEQTVFDPEVTRANCRQAGIRYENRGGVWGCLMAADRRSPRYTRVAADTSAPLYPVPDLSTLPAQLPRSMFLYPENGTQPLSGERIYIGYVIRYGPVEGRLMFNDHVALQRTSCMGLEEPRRPRREGQSYSDSGFRYRDRGGGFTVRHDYRYVEERRTRVERSYDAELERYHQMRGLCEDFNEDYDRTGGFRNRS